MASKHWPHFFDEEHLNFEGEQIDPMIKVELLGQTKVTDYKPASLSPIFNELLFFEYTNLTIEDVETAMIKISLKSFTKLWTERLRDLMNFFTKNW